MIFFTYIMCLSMGFSPVLSKKESMSAGIQMDESRVSDIGWTDAHNVAYGWPIRLPSGTEVVVQDVSSFLESARNDFLCRQNDFGQTALHLAVRQDVIEIVSLYAQRGVCLNIANRDGDTPLHYAAFWGRPRSAKILLEAGADSEMKNHLGNTAKDDALSEEHKDVLFILEPFRGNTATWEF
jgi:ankyrin repeat protein